MIKDLLNIAEKHPVCRQGSFLTCFSKVINQTNAQIIAEEYELVKKLKHSITCT